MSTKPLPDGWAALVDSAGKTYYANSKTGASSWFHPAEVVSSGGAARAAVGASKSEAETKQQLSAEPTTREKLSLRALAIGP